MIKLLITLFLLITVSTMSGQNKPLSSEITANNGDRIILISTDEYKALIKVFATHDSAKEIYTEHQIASQYGANVNRSRLECLDLQRSGYDCNMDEIKQQNPQFEFIGQFLIIYKHKQ